MTEKLLQFIWRFQHFDKHELLLTDGQPLEILFPGIFNTSQGPDFLEASIRVNNTTWFGHIELHIKASDWKKHAHDLDRNYDNVILHVVWNDDLHEKDLLTLELSGRVSRLLLRQYEDWMNAQNTIACGRQIALTDEMVLSSWKTRLVAEKLERKRELINKFLEENNRHWEQTFWWMIARSFGSSINGEAFEAMARSVPVELLSRHKHQIHQLEALLLGQAGLLNETFADPYPTMLQKEYRFYQRKYQLNPIRQSIHFLRMLPINFPTVRLAQLAMLIHRSTNLFSTIRETELLAEVYELLETTANDYWHYHYVFDEPSSFKPKKVGRTMINHIVINTIAPVLFAYGNSCGQTSLSEKAIRWLEETTAEDNRITQEFLRLGIASRNAFDSQAVIELKTNYCEKLRCLECAVGNSILKSAVVKT